MKKYFIPAIFILVSIGIIVGCKKDSDSKNAMASIIDKTWAGGLSYTGKTQEYYSVRFNVDKSLVWSQLSGDYPGEWVVNGKQITMTFPGIASTIKADIANDGKMLNISDDNTSYTINSGQLVPNPAMILENTTWSMVLGNTSGYELIFQPGLKVDVKLGSALVATLNYQRVTSGGGVRLISGGGAFFGVILSDNEMKGSNGNSETPWQAKKK